MKKASRRAVFLDRDGVINRTVIRAGKPNPPSCLEELEIIPGVAEALKELREAGFLIICVTNQPDVSRGKQHREVVEAMHKKLLDSLALDEILVCYHDNHDNCLCRKPLPGMILDAAERLAINLAESFMVGDRWRDIEAGSNAGVMTVLIEYGYSERKSKTTSDILVHSLAEAVDWMLQQF